MIDHEKVFRCILHTAGSLERYIGAEKRMAVSRSGRTHERWTITIQASESRKIHVQYRQGAVEVFSDREVDGFGTINMESQTEAVFNEKLASLASLVCTETIGVAGIPLRSRAEKKRLMERAYNYADTIFRLGVEGLSQTGVPWGEYDDSLRWETLTRIAHENHEIVKPIHMWEENCVPYLGIAVFNHAVWDKAEALLDSIKGES